MGAEKHWGARGVARVSGNPCCRVQAVMVHLDVDEGAFYESYVGRPCPEERGERTAALRWGTRFDAHLAEQHAAALLTALDGHFGITRATATVRDLRQEVPGDTPADLLERRRRTTQVIADLLHGRPSCDVLLQPPLPLRIGPRQVLSVVPDSLVLDRIHEVYLPLEAKGFIAIDGMSEPGDRDQVRQQAAVQIHALRDAFARFGAGDRVTPQALLVFATPFGLRPHPAVLENLDAECEAVTRAIRTLADTASHLHRLRQSMPLPQALHQLPNHFEESCLTSCAMAGACRLRASGLIGHLGDGAGRSFDPSVDLARVVALLSGAPPRTPEESDLLAQLQATSTRFGWDWS
jgi:hypothetical protein